MAPSTLATAPLPPIVPPVVPPVVLTVAAELTIDAGLPLGLRRAITQALTLPNPQFLEAEEHGRSTADLDADLYYYRGTATGELVVPRGAGCLVRALFEEHEIPVRVVDATHAAPPLFFEERVVLSDAQERAVGDMLTRRIGVLSSPAGSGKTVMAMALIARRQQPSLFIVHTKELLYQAVARAVAVLGLDESEIGVVGDAQCTVGAKLTVAWTCPHDRGSPDDLVKPESRKSVL